MLAAQGLLAEHGTQWTLRGYLHPLLDQVCHPALCPYPLQRKVSGCFVNPILGWHLRIRVLAIATVWFTFIDLGFLVLDVEKVPVSLFQRLVGYVYDGRLLLRELLLPQGGVYRFFAVALVGGALSIRLRMLRLLVLFVAAFH